MDFETQASHKNNFGFKELASLTGVKPYVLRFWESEFVQIDPQIDNHGNKLYSQTDLEFVNKIKSHLFEEKLSIPEVKALLDKNDSEFIQEVIEDTLVEGEVENSGYVHVSPSIAMMQSALKSDIERVSKKATSTSFNDKDVLHLVQAKKKLTSVLRDIQNTFENRDWN